MVMIKSFLTRDVTPFFIRRFSSFTYLNVTQFLGALNDNLYKLLIVYFLIDLQGIEYCHHILAITGAIFVLPFLLFSATSGTLADKLSKRNIIVATKILEFISMVAAVFSFYFESIFGCYAILFLLALQSAIFGPSKYGILPELVETDKISKANGLMTSFTFLAIILGTFFASFILDISGRHYIFAGAVCLALSIIGLITSFCIEYTQPAGSDKKINFLFLSAIYATLKDARQEPSLLAAIIGSAFFLFLGAFVQLNMIPFAVQALHLTDIQGGYLFLITAVGIGTGSLLAGKISGRLAELGIVPIAGAGIAISLYAIDIFSSHLYAAVPLVMIMGMFGGFYQVPLDSYIQIASPNKTRGEIIAATNFLSYVGVLCASFLLYLMTEVFQFSASKGFTVIGDIALVVTVLITYQFYDYLSRFAAMILSRLHFQITFNGIENISDTPALYICTHTAWNDTLLMLGAQRRRMRFFIEHEHEHTRWLKKLYRLLRIVNIPSIEPLENNEYCLLQIRKILDSGFSVCIFIDDEDTAAAIQKLHSSYPFKQILENTDYKIIPVTIEKGTKEKMPRIFKRLLHKFRVPASISFG
jgi:acyl-[acyl-carrier-protein]-phospholipid O-acyltransferase/long-chain-fatty-acid--[acyl-carrier-protein] ligase